MIEVDVEGLFDDLGGDDDDRSGGATAAGWDVVAVRRGLSGAGLSSPVFDAACDALALACGHTCVEELDERGAGAGPRGPQVAGGGLGVGDGVADDGGTAFTFVDHGLEGAGDGGEAAVGVGGGGLVVDVVEVDGQAAGAGGREGCAGGDGAGGRRRQGPGEAIVPAQLRSAGLPGLTDGSHWPSPGGSGHAYRARHRVRLLQRDHRLQQGSGPCPNAPGVQHTGAREPGSAAPGPAPARCRGDLPSAAGTQQAAGRAVRHLPCPTVPAGRDVLAAGHGRQARPDVDLRRLAAGARVVSRRPLATGSGLSGPAARRAIHAATHAPAFAGTTITARQARDLLCNPALAVHDNPHALLLCVYNRDKALCHRIGPHDTPRLDRCVSACANIARTDLQAEQLIVQAEELEKQAVSPMVPAPLADRLQNKAAGLRHLAEQHDLTRITLQEKPA